MKQKAVLVDYRAQFKDCGEVEYVRGTLLDAQKQWEAVGGIVTVYFNPGEGVAHLIVSDVTPEIIALVHETSDQCPDISYVKEAQPIIQAMKEELIECIGGPDIDDTEVEALYEILAGNKEVQNDTCH